MPELDPVITAVLPERVIMRSLFLAECCTCEGKGKRPLGNKKNAGTKPALSR
jgi:hypothetical protein